jgi:hypothetical protein
MGISGEKLYDLDARGGIDHTSHDLPPLQVHEAAVGAPDDRDADSGFKSHFTYRGWQ